MEKVDYQNLPADLQNRLKAKTTSVAKCELCLSLIEIRNVRQSPMLCAGCSGKKGMMKRYGDFQKNKLSEAERLKILNSKTTRTGPFWSPNK